MVKKVLYLTNSIYCPEINEFSRNKVGICRSVSESAQGLHKRGFEIFILTTTFNKSYLINGVKIIGFSLKNLLSYIKFRKILSYIFLCFKSSRKFRSKIALFKNLLAEGYIQQTIKEISPDVINVHGLTLDTLSFIDAAKCLNKKIIITLHGLNSLDKSISISDFERSFEKYFFSIKDDILITVISTGVKDNMLKKLHIKTKYPIMITPNGVNLDRFGREYNKNFLKNIYNIPKSKKVILYVGSLSKRKNQIFLLKTLKYFEKDLRNKIYILIVGEGRERKNLEKYIFNNNLQNYVKLLGNKDGIELVKIYNMADIFVSTTNSEGFGNIFIEAFAAGIPVVTFKDLDAIEDLYNPKCMLLANERNESVFAETIKNALNLKWNTSTIRRHAKKFTWDKALNKYIEAYNFIGRKN